MLTVAADPDCGKQTLRLSGPRFTLETNITLRLDRMTLANPNRTLKGKRQQYFKAMHSFERSLPVEPNANARLADLA